MHYGSFFAIKILYIYYIQNFLVATMPSANQSSLIGSLIASNKDYH